MDFSISLGSYIDSQFGFLVIPTRKKNVFHAFVQCSQTLANIKTQQESFNEHWVDVSESVKNV